MKSISLGLVLLVVCGGTVYSEPIVKNQADEGDSLKELAIERYLLFQGALTDSKDNPCVTVFRNYVQVTGNEWTYIFDVSGNQVFRPVSLYEHMRPRLTGAIESKEARDVPIAVINKLLDRTTAYAKQLTREKD